MRTGRATLCGRSKPLSTIDGAQALFAANRELITRFEVKIQATLARVWGEAAPAVEPEVGEPAAATEMASAVA